MEHKYSFSQRRLYFISVQMVITVQWILSVYCKSISFGQLIDFSEPCAGHKAPNRLTKCNIKAVKQSTALLLFECLCLSLKPGKMRPHKWNGRSTINTRNKAYPQDQGYTPNFGAIPLKLGANTPNFRGPFLKKCWNSWILRGGKLKNVVQIVIVKEFFQ